jgi:hypothetical protein
MSTESNNPNKLAFSTQCLPGSAAELKETERLVEFHRVKAVRKAQEARDKPQLDAQREEVYEANREANYERMRKSGRARQTSFLRS